MQWSVLINWVLSSKKLDRQVGLYGPTFAGQNARNSVQTINAN